MNTGIKAPEGMGIVVETADIQNCVTKTGSGKDGDPSQRFVMLSNIFKGNSYGYSARQEGGGYLHDEEEEEDDEHADTRM